MDIHTRLYLIRHGQVANFSEGACNGQKDVDITELGVRQMEAVAARLKHENLTGVYCSDLIRTKRGGDVMAAEHGLTPEPCPAFRELNFGLWEGLTMKEIEERFPDALNEWRGSIVEHRMPQGESIRDLAGRVIPALRKILNVNYGGNIVLVAHGWVNRVILLDAVKLDLENFFSIEQDYSCLNIIDYFSEFAVVKLVNGQSPKDY